MKILQEAAKLDLRINKITEDTDALNIKGIEILSLLDTKEMQSYMKLDKMNLFILE